MDINRLTEKAQEALRAAQSEATRQGRQQIDVEHLRCAPPQALCSRPLRGLKAKNFPECEGGWKNVDGVYK